MPKKDEELKVEVRQKALVSQQGSPLHPQIARGFHARRGLTVDVLRKNLAKQLNLEGSKHEDICAQLQIRVVGKEDAKVPEDQCRGTLYDQNSIDDTLRLILKDESSSEPLVEPPVAPVVMPVAAVEAMEPPVEAVEPPVEAVEPVPVEAERQTQLAKDMAVQEQDRCTGAMHRMMKERSKEEALLRTLQGCGILRVFALSYFIVV